jgi:hypothetical protein
MRGIVVSLVEIWLVVGSVFMALEIARKEPAGVSRRKTETTNSLGRSR